MSSEPSRLLLVHISDLHIREKNDHGLSQLRNLETAFERFGSECIPVICVTGDISHSGSRNEFKLFADELNRLTEELKKRFAEVKIFVVPGNHDCVLTGEDKFRERLLQSIRAGEDIEEEMLSFLARPQENFFEMLKNFPGETLDGVHSFEKGVALKVGNQKVGFLLINSSLFSRRNEVAGKLLLPSLPLIDDQADLVVALFHHPLNWYEAGVSREFRRYLDQNADFVLCGHEHEEDIYERRKVESNVLYFESLRFSGHKPQRNDGFRIIEVDLRDDKFRVFNFVFSDSRPCENNSFSSDWQGFRKNSNRASLGFALTKSFAEDLADLGMNIRHPRKERPTLEELFIFPRLKHQNVNPADKENETQKGYLSESEFFDDLSRGQSFLITGEQDSGKTSLAKKTATHLLRQGKLPLLISAQDLKGLEKMNESKLQKQFNEFFSEMYTRPTFGEYFSLPKNNRVLLLDDFTNVGLNGKGLSEFVTILRKIFHAVVIFGDASQAVVQLINSVVDRVMFEDFRHYEISEIGKKMRLDIIEKWVRLDQELSISETNLVREIDESTRQLEVVLGTELLPSYPINVLFILSQISSPGNLTAPPGTYAKFIEILINEGFLRDSSDHSRVTTYETLLGRFANFLEERKQRRVSLEEFSQFLNGHNELYALNLENDHELSRLKRLNILSETFGEVGFRYPYLRSYFYASHLASAKSSGDFKAVVDGLISSIHLESNSNVLVFLGSKSNSEELLKALSEKAKSLWSDQELFKFEDARELIDQLSASQIEHDISVPSSTPIENRKKLTEIEDDSDGEPRSIHVKDEREVSSKVMGEITSTIRLIHVIGQLVRTYHGKLSSEKKQEMLAESFAMMLRLNSFVVNETRKDIPGFQEAIRTAIRRKRGDENEDLVEDSKVRETIFFFVQMLSMGLAKRYSTALGHKNLRISFNQVFDERNEVAAKMYHLTMKLDHMDGFPEEGVFTFFESLKSNHLAKGILRHLVANHLTYFPMPESPKQRICKKLDLKYGSVKVGELKRIESKR